MWHSSYTLALAGALIMVAPVKADHLAPTGDRYAKDFKPYFEGAAGLLNAAYSVRGGISDSFDISGGYQKDSENDVDLHTLSAEAYKNVSLSDKIVLKLGGGIGFTIPNFEAGPYKGDNGHSWILGAIGEYPITPHVSIVGGVKGFFFTTDRHKTWYTSHTETYYVNGVEAGQAEVLDVHHYNDRANYDKVLALIGLRYNF